jgi:tetratricopeptide (TPR) repeat protein
MLNPRKKMTKKEIKEDKFVEVALSAKAYVEDNYKQVSIIVLSVFGVILLLMVWNYVHHQNAEKSSVLLGQAQLEYQNLNYSKAKEFINQLTDEYPGTDACDQGTFLYANLLYQEKNYAEAKDLYKKFIDSYSGSNILIASGLAGYAACLEKEENYEEAAEYYMRAQKKAKDFIEAPNYLYLAGLNYTAADDYEDARDAFQKIVDDYESSDHQTDAKAKLIILANK